MVGTQRGAYYPPLPMVGTQRGALSPPAPIGRHPEVPSSQQSLSHLWEINVREWDTFGLEQGPGAGVGEVMFVEGKC